MAQTIRIRRQDGRCRFEKLETRELLAADLAAYWLADNLIGQVDDGGAVDRWPDSVTGRNSNITGAPTHRALQSTWGDRSSVEFDGEGGDEGFLLKAADNPLAGAGDFAVIVTFATDSHQLVGEQGHWFNNTGIVDGNALGIASDWGLTMNAAGQLSVGLGGGFSSPPKTLYSTATGLNDGQRHMAAVVRQGSTLSLYVDDLPVDSMDGYDLALSQRDLAIGKLAGAVGKNPFEGQIGAVRIFSGALTSTEVNAEFTELNQYYGNQRPVAVDDVYTTVEDILFFNVVEGQGVLANDSDADGDQLQATLVEEPSHGSLIFRENGSFLYNSNNDFFGVDTFTYTVSDFRASEPATVTINVTPQDDPVTPMADHYQSLPSELLQVDVAQGVLANDLNPDQSDLVVQLVDDVSDGQLTLATDGSFHYDPQGFSGTTLFTYQIDDGQEITAPTTVTLVLNTPPVIEPDAYELDEDQVVDLPAEHGVLSNDIDADGNSLQAELIEAPLHGTLELNADGSFRYTPEQDYFGSDQFTYTMNDGVDSGGEATVQLTILAVNDAPNAQSDVYVTLPDRAIEVAPVNGLLRNDIDVDSPTIEAHLESAAANGTVNLTLDGSFSYDPNPGFVGLDSFTYRAGDTDLLSEVQTVSIRVAAQPIVINEFMMINQSTLETNTRTAVEDDFRASGAAFYDWIELRNPFDEPLPIGGFYLTDNLNDLTKWQIPYGTVIDANGLLTIFASGLDITDPQLDESGSLHTSFRISADEAVAIGTVGGLVLDAFESVPQQHPDVSYGRDAFGNAAYFSPATPGAINESGLLGTVADTQFSVDRGFFDAPQAVEITTATEGATIYFTTDGSQPHPNNASAQPYVAPITIATTTTLRAAAFHDQRVPSNVDTQSYIFLSDVRTQGNSPVGYPDLWKVIRDRSLPADYEIDPEIVDNPAYSGIFEDALRQVPTISIVTDIDHLFDRDEGLYQNPLQSGIDWERPASVELINPDGSVGFQINAGLRIQGGASREPEKSPKHSFRLLFKEAYGAPKLNYPLFGPDSVDEFDTIILRAGFNQSYIHHNTFLGDNRGRAQYVRDQWAKDTQLAMGHVAAHNSYAHLYINGMYWGLYNPTERPTDGFAVSYFGGEKDEWDAVNSEQIVDGNNEAWRELASLYREDLSVPENYQAVAEVVDLDAFIDYMMINHYGANMDWPSHNWYALRHRVEDGKWYFFMWDSEFLFIQNDDNRIPQTDGTPGRLFNSLDDNAEFRMRVADRMQMHARNGGLLTPESVIERWNARSDQITDAIVAESARWGDYRRDVHNRGTPLVLLERDVHWVSERERLLTDYFPQRTEIAVQQYRDRELFPSIETANFSQRGGTVDAGAEIALTADDGLAIYYTTDGSDPRLSGGLLNPTATLYEAPLQLTQHTTVRVRTQAPDGEWSAIDQATFLVDTDFASADNLRITEINYHPADPTADEIAAGHDNDNDFEFIELTNISDRRIDLSNVQLRQSVDGDRRIGVGFDFATADVHQLLPGQSLVVVEDTDAFPIRYPGNILVAGQWTGGLNNASEQITLIADDQIIHQFSYSDQWYPTTDGQGATLEHVNPAGVLASWNVSTGWRASNLAGGSPGTTENAPLAGDANGDGRFNIDDLTLVFSAGEYDDDVVGNSTFAEGDWNGDGDFDSDDLLFVFAQGHYEPTLVALAVDALFAPDT